MRSKGRLALDEERFGDAAALSGASRSTARVKSAMLASMALEEALRRARPSGGWKALARGACDHLASAG